MWHLSHTQRLRIVYENEDKVYSHHQLMMGVPWMYLNLDQKKASCDHQPLRHASGNGGSGRRSVRRSEREGSVRADGRSGERCCPLVARGCRTGPPVQLGLQVPHLLGKVGQLEEDRDGPAPVELCLWDPAEVPLHPQADGWAFQAGQDQVIGLQGLPPPGLIELARGGLGELHRLHPGTDPHTPQPFFQAVLLLPEEALLW
ncbi:hypothetical protein COCON_G00170080 [Conger conger]|uniref:Uncharacterized protein n=1 Tax=Conger conger TaxID=82655 RepID=A0A9Q1D8D5_CONCO|nr:hypothetical protein COCON_G00170080 [Conger conger]